MGFYVARIRSQNDRYEVVRAKDKDAAVSAIIRARSSCGDSSPFVEYQNGKIPGNLREGVVAVVTIPAHEDLKLPFADYTLI